MTSKPRLSYVDPVYFFFLLFQPLFSQPAEGQWCELTASTAWTAELPVGFQIGGAYLNRDGAALVWDSGNTGGALLLYEAGKRQPINLPDDVAVGGAAMVDGKIMVLNTAKVESVGIDRSGAILSRRSLPVIGDLLSGVWNQDTWLTLNVRGTPVKHTVRRNGEKEWEVTIDAPDGPGQKMWLSLGESTAYVASATSPYSILQIDGSSPRPGLEVLARDVAEEFLADPTQRWIALPALFLGKDVGILQTFVDMMSDLRRTVRFALDGSVLSVLEFEAPLAFIGASGSGSGGYLLATLRVKGPELALYRWQCIPQ